MANSFYVLVETDPSSAQKVLDALLHRLEPAGLVDFLDTVVDPFLRQRISDRFSSEGDDVTGSWDPLAAATQQIRAAYGYPPDHPINVRTDKLRSWLVGTHSDVRMNGVGAELQHPPPNGDAITMKKLQTAQSGSGSPPTPARPVLGVNDNDQIFITSSLAAYLTQDII